MGKWNQEGGGDNGEGPKNTSAGRTRIQKEA